MHTFVFNFISEKLYNTLISTSLTYLHFFRFLKLIIGANTLGAAN